MKLKASTSIKGALIYVSFDSSPKDGDIESSPVIYFQASCDDGTTISSRKIKLSMEPGWYFLPIYPTPSETEDSASEIHPTKVEPTLDTGKKDIPFDLHSPSSLRSLMSLSVSRFTLNCCSQDSSVNIHNILFVCQADRLIEGLRREIEGIQSGSSETRDMTQIISKFSVSGLDLMQYSLLTSSKDLSTWSIPIPSLKSLATEESTVNCDSTYFAYSRILPLWPEICAICGFSPDGAITRTKKGAVGAKDDIPFSLTLTLHLIRIIESTMISLSSYGDVSRLEQFCGQICECVCNIGSHLLPVLHNLLKTWVEDKIHGEEEISDDVDKSEDVKETFKTPVYHPSTISKYLSSFLSVITILSMSTPSTLFTSACSYLPIWTGIICDFSLILNNSDGSIPVPDEEEGSKELLHLGLLSKDLFQKLCQTVHIICLSLSESSALSLCVGIIPSIIKYCKSCSIGFILSESILTLVETFLFVCPCSCMYLYDLIICSDVMVSFVPCVCEEQSISQLWMTCVNILLKYVLYRLPEMRKAQLHALSQFEKSEVNHCCSLGHLYSELKPLSLVSGSPQFTTVISLFKSFEGFASIYKYHIPTAYLCVFYVFTVVESFVESFEKVCGGDVVKGKKGKKGKKGSKAVESETKTVCPSIIDFLNDMTSFLCKISK
ncbi:hypothetical protein ADUPG1_011064, partial [Aduncisulcus paluster]